MASLLNTIVIYSTSFPQCLLTEESHYSLLPTLVCIIINRTLQPIKQFQQYICFIKQLDLINNIHIPNHPPLKHSCHILFQLKSILLYGISNDKTSYYIVLSNQCPPFSIINQTSTHDLLISGAANSPVAAARRALSTSP